MIEYINGYPIVMEGPTPGTGITRKGRIILVDRNPDVDPNYKDHRGVTAWTGDGDKTWYHGNYFDGHASAVQNFYKRLVENKGKPVGLRWEDAYSISQGACNPLGIANTIVKACAECREINVDTHDDPAIRLMVYQLASVMGMEPINANEFWHDDYAIAEHIHRGV